MPTVRQQRIKLKRQVDTTRIVKTVELQKVKSLTDGTTTTEEIDIPVEVWDNPPEIMKIREGDEGREVWLAGQPSTFTARITEIRWEKNQASLKIIDRRSDRGVGSYKDVWLEEIIIHPDVLEEERLSEQYTIEDKRKA